MHLTSSCKPNMPTIVELGAGDTGCSAHCDVSLTNSVVEYKANSFPEGLEIHGTEKQEKIDASLVEEAQTTTVSKKEPETKVKVNEYSPEQTALKVFSTSASGEVKIRMEESGFAAEPPITVSQLFVESVRKYGNYTALAFKQGDQWKTMTYKQYHEECRKAAKSFLQLGLMRFHGVGILGFNSPEWFIADIGAILAGGFAVGIYATNSPEACLYVAENCEANIIVVENHKQLQKILEIQERLPHLKAIVQYSGQLKEKQPNLYSWAEFMKLGSKVSDSRLDEVIASQKPNQCCTLIYTSGTTGNPKGVMLSHDNLTWTALVAGSTIRLREATEFQEVVVSYLPLSHIAAQMVDIWLPMKFGAVTYFAQPDALKGSLGNTLREARPTAFLGVPRVWEKMEEKMKSTGAKSSTAKRKIATWAKTVGLQTNRRRINGSSASLSYRIAKKMVFKKVRKALGLDRCFKCYTGAAPITKETLEFFLSLDIPIYELYGMSECSGPHTITLPETFRLTSCGKVISGCKTMLYQPDNADIGEVCFWGRHVFMGYLNMEDKTAESLDTEGWLHSGDLGNHDKDGCLYITGRIKELIITAGGENIPPVLIEDAVKEQVPLISNCMLIGDQRKFLAMLITLKCNVNEDTGEPEDDLTPEAISICEKLGSKAKKVSDILGSKDKTVYNAIQEGINRVNMKAASNAQKIQKWDILEKDFSVAGEELGPTMKLKRPFVLQMYKDRIENFYNEADTPTTPENPLPSK
ncbi:long-chain-fatty-acid--CoA ligase ACSBG2 isoform X3 [Latimeria chalumnae]|uniref:long-chain-fatty-acid--CoA ligase ACSBG2 isoform X3 n=1 Tax=Latimeria chalumnae TaxID=7897 RepID=UPI0006D91AB7|nr:PREDICTED: long-chain-fatty-acid--CoA ligase ACSBG2 isoform X3 [Latimeria chalumnae]|eukprot:XP_014340428.1 PREDICTED: long-chain-fatty-acid--CoA ligase ACSBG2 isoform X3 [Latimeria chalumnae]